MIAVSFASREEAEALYKMLDDPENRTLFHVKKEDMQVFIEGSQRGLTTYTRDKLSQLLTRFIIDYYEDRWFLEILKSQFYYTDPDEQAMILDIIHSILTGEREDLPNLNRLPKREDLIRTSIQDLLKSPTTFSFESIETFRLHRYHSWLLRMTELALDEYKLQQEYASFVEKLRLIIRNYSPLQQTIYVIDEKPFKLYNDRFELIESVPSIRSFYPLLKQWGIETKPSVILSLIGLSPKKVYVYTDRPDADEMLTIQKVFEERVTFHPFKEAKTQKWKA
ncbi:sporulation protein YtxC [Pullulanibacillus sp. KACC 23026]|uniref:sporulation protein YtxC n=1 Tax=Pullulanibacillus sp. KACC 23026 TaxID=3028315 RepID=UPI0023AF68EA|nr:sporulation protein YtxC [Pullulanibacillus sp. KACC 23026]WEG13916.1 sporulation protein YtxC [Pullulanibacillus sp. KACC 23026]